MTASYKPFAIITGASRGIGAEYARALAYQGYDLLLISRDEERLTRLSCNLKADYSIQVFTGNLDLSQPDSAHQLFGMARNFRGATDLLINNAGFGLYGEFASQPMKHIQQMISLHIQTVTESVRLFLPNMIARATGAIINVASIAGMLPIPYFAEYAATKAFLISFSEALAEEVRSTGVQIQVCCPGQTETGFHSTAGFKPSNPLPIQKTTEVVQASLAALRVNQTVVTIGWQGKIYSLLAKWLPRKLLAKKAGEKIKAALKKINV